MTRSVHVRRVIGRTLLLMAGLAAADSGLTGCASPGIPRPPSLHLPATVTDLTASRIGDRVELRWTEPTATTDGLELTDPRQGPTTVEVCRDVALGALAADRAGCTGVLRVAGHAGASTLVDELPAEMRGEGSRGELVAYRVRVLNSHGRAAGPSARVLVAGGPAVAGVTDFSATDTRRGVVLRWGGGGEGTVEVERTEMGAAADGPRRAGRGKGAAAAKKGKDEDAAMVRLHTETGGGEAGAHGMLDTGVARDTTYSYRAQRTRVISLGGERILARSEPSDAVTIVRRSTFAPDAPGGLASVPGGTAERPEIDLSWRPSGETDLRGYVVYRREGGSGEWRRITAEAGGAPSFRDVTVVAGREYGYRVTAVDSHGNESAPSDVVADRTF